jgi:hypothetical protein
LRQDALCRFDTILHCDAVSLSFANAMLVVTRLAAHLGLNSFGRFAQGSSIVTTTDNAGTPSLVALGSAF